jgi:HEPN domain-containing protein
MATAEEQWILAGAFLVGILGAYFLSGKKRYRANIGQFADAHFRAAEEDLDAAKVLAQRENRLASFHVQQAAEKVLKGIGAHHQVDPLKGHEMRGSWKRIPDSDFRNAVPDFDELVKYATQFRYPRKGFPGLDRGMDYTETMDKIGDIEAAMELARERYGRQVSGP